MAKVVENKTVETVEFTTENAEMVNTKTGEVIGSSLVVNADANQLDNAKNAFAKIKAGQYKRGVALTSDYYEFGKAGETVIGCFIGIKDVNMTDTATKQPKILTTAYWLGEDENGSPKMYCNGGQQLVEAFKMTMPRTFVEIKYLGKKGQMKKYEITPIIISE
jgi:hypothetical protein